MRFLFLFFFKHFQTSAWISLKNAAICFRLLRSPYKCVFNKRHSILMCFRGDLFNLHLYCMSRSCPCTSLEFIFNVIPFSILNQWCYFHSMVFIIDVIPFLQISPLMLFIFSSLHRWCYSFSLDLIIDVILSYQIVDLLHSDVTECGPFFMDSTFFSPKCRYSHIFFLGF